MIFFYYIYTLKCILCCYSFYYNSTDGPRKVVIYPATSNYTRNETLDSLGPINCTANCKPACTSTGNGPNLPPGTTSVLSLVNINRNQAGNYQCTASNYVSSSISATIYVVVNCKYEWMNCILINQIHIVTEK